MGDFWGKQPIVYDFGILRTRLGGLVTAYMLRFR